MPKLTRQNMKIFGSSATALQRAKIGSLAAGTPEYTTDVEEMQSYPNYLAGWFDCVLGSNSPAIEDMNSLCYVLAYQLAYIMQAGVPEWDDATTYYIGSLVNDGSGNLYVSLIDTNLNQALTDTSKWRRTGSGNAPNTVSINPATQSPYTLQDSDNGKTFLVNSANGAMVFNMPAAVLNFSFTAKDVGGSLGTNNMTFVRNGSESLEGVAATYTASAPWGSWTWDCNGTNWFIIGGK